MIPGYQNKNKKSYLDTFCILKYSCKMSRHCTVLCGPVIAQLVERRTVEWKQLEILRSLVRLRFAGDHMHFTICSDYISLYLMEGFYNFQYIFSLYSHH